MSEQKSTHPPAPIDRATSVTFAEFAAQQHDRLAQGRLYGLEFPYTADQLRELGAAWLTRAFHTAGTLDKDNAVQRIVAMSGLDDGGAGDKCLMQIEYAKADAGLATRLFVKMPHGRDKMFDKYLCAVVFNQFVPEVVFGARLSEQIPVATPKCFFADYEPGSLNFITIHADISQDVKELHGSTYKRGPRLHKCMDYRHPNVTPYYDMIVQQLGAMCGWSKGQPIRELFAQHPTFRSGGEATGGADVSLLIELITDVGRAVMPAELLEPAFLSTLEAQLKHIAGYPAAFGAYVEAKPDYVAYGHINLNVDNALFFESESGALISEVVDWGGYTDKPIVHLLMGALSCSEAEDFERNIERWLASFIEQYTRAGGPQLDYAELSLQLDLAIAFSAAFAHRLVPLIYQNLAKEDWARITGRTDPVLEDNFLARCWSRTIIAALQRYKRRNAYASFLKWLDTGLPAKPR